MNPVTHQLLVHIKDQRIVRFVEAWDALEALVIRIYKSQQAIPEDERLYQRIRHRLRRLIFRYSDALELYWRQTTINARPVTDNPFIALIAPDDAAAFVSDWDRMQQLPAAREALNSWLLDWINEQ